MASIVKRRKKYSVVYTYKDEEGNKKQKWETWGTKKEAMKRKLEIESDKLDNRFVAPSSITVSDLMYRFVISYGKNTWAVSTYTARKGLIDNYINPILGDMNVCDLSETVIDEYYSVILPNTPAALKFGQKESNTMVSPRNIREIHKVMNCALKYAIKLKIINTNPANDATLPKVTSAKREIWTFETLQKALSLCDDEQLSLCIHLAFACSMRIGEICGLTWDSVYISEEHIEKNDAYIDIDKTLQRLSKEDIEELNAVKNGRIIKVYPSISPRAKTRLVLKDGTKNGHSRRVWLPKTVALMLKRAKYVQEEWKDILGNEYTDNNHVISLPNGRPTDLRVVEKWFKTLIRDNDLPDVVFHSLRHTSTTYKLKLNGGDIKAVQGDTGHMQAKMVTEVYSHILDEDRKHNAEKFENEFYQKEESQKEDTTDKASQLLDLLDSSPEVLEQILNLANQLKNN